jgi:hypothetical protein
MPSTTKRRTADGGDSTPPSGPIVASVDSTLSGAPVYTYTFAMARRRTFTVGSSSSGCWRAVSSAFA